MPVPLSGYRVFIACPSGLEAERSEFRSLLIDHNADDAHERGVTFLPTGWEYTLAGRGRPQSLIDEEVRRSDYLILLLWDRWGTRPRPSSYYTSGTEEEYNVARECLMGDYPMKDIVVLFKGVEERQLSDPGHELKRVLEFKSVLQSTGEQLYSTFDSADEFRREIRRHLQRWVRDHEQSASGITSSVRPPPPPPPLTSDSAMPDVDTAEAAEGRTANDVTEPSQIEETSEIIAEARRLKEAGQIAAAETLFAQVVSASTEDPQALASYAVFLRQIGRLSHAAAVDERLLRIGNREDDVDMVIDALANLGVIKRKEGYLEDAKQHFEQAISVAEQRRSDSPALAFLHDNLGLTLRRMGQSDKAESEHRIALRLREEQMDPVGKATALNNLGFLMRERGELDSAIRLHEEALALFVANQHARGQASALANIAAIEEQRGDVQAAENTYLKSLDLNESLQSPDGLGMNYSQLASLYLNSHRFEKARDFAEKCLAINEKAGSREGIASALHLLGRLDLAAGDNSDAISLLTSAMDLFQEIGHKLGSAGSAADLALALLRAGKIDEAMPIFKSALTTAAGLDHEQLRRRVAEIQEEFSSQ
jgi:tetratricopeptide (TPR) repeat protein